MNKKILISSLIVLTMLLIMPSIPAVQQNNIKEGCKQDFQDNIDEIDLDSLKGNRHISLPKHLVLYGLIIFLITFRNIRAKFFYLKYNLIGDNIITEYFFFTRGALLYLKALSCALIWTLISDEFGWNWKLPFPDEPNP